VKLVIAGSRKLFPSVELIKSLVDQFKLSPSLIIEGGANGVDRQGRKFAETYDITYKTYEADWNNLSREGAVVRSKNGRKYDAAAGHVRNQKQADDGDVLLAIWDGESTGSLDMIKRMRNLNKPVFEFIIKVP